LCVCVCACVAVCAAVMNGSIGPTGRTPRQCQRPVTLMTRYHSVGVRRAPYCEGREVGGGGGVELPSQRATLAKDERRRPRRPAGLAARARRVSAARCVSFVRAARSVVVCGRRVTSCLSVAGIVRDHMMEALAKIDTEVAAAQSRAASDRAPAIVTTTAGAGAGAGGGAGGGAGAGVASATSAPPECAVRIADAATFAEVAVTSRFEALGLAVHCLMLQAGFVCTGHDIVDRAVPGFAPPLRGAILRRRRAFVHVNDVVCMCLHVCVSAVLGDCLSSDPRATSCLPR
jgi:hypothetical protein